MREYESCLRRPPCDRLLPPLQQSSFGIVQPVFHVEDAIADVLELVESPPSVIEQLFLEHDATAKPLREHDAPPRSRP